VNPAALTSQASDDFSPPVRALTEGGVEVDKFTLARKVS
jgi:hypothetical protein